MLRFIPDKKEQSRYLIYLDEILICSEGYNSNGYLWNDEPVKISLKTIFTLSLNDFPKMGGLFLMKRIPYSYIYLASIRRTYQKIELEFYIDNYSFSNEILNIPKFFENLVEFFESDIVKITHFGFDRVTEFSECNIGFKSEFVLSSNDNIGPYIEKSLIELNSNVKSYLWRWINQELNLEKFLDNYQKNDISLDSFKKKIKILIAEADLETVFFEFSMFQDKLSPQKNKDFILLQYSFYKVTKDINRGLIKKEDELPHLVRISKGLLELL